MMTMTKQINSNSTLLTISVIKRLSKNSTKNARIRTSKCCLTIWLDKAPGRLMRRRHHSRIAKN